MDTHFCEKDEIGPLGIVFFCNEFIRSLDVFKTSHNRSAPLGNLCDKAISFLHALNCEDTEATTFATGFMSTADEIATLATSLESHFKIKNSQDATRKVNQIINAICRIKTQKEFTQDLERQIDLVSNFLSHLADEGLASCRRQASGESTDAERVWKHYATIC